MIMKFTETRSLRVHFVFPKFERNRPRGVVARERKVLNFYCSLWLVGLYAIRPASKAQRRHVK